MKSDTRLPTTETIGHLFGYARRQTRGHSRSSAMLMPTPTSCCPPPGWSLLSRTSYWPIQCQCCVLAVSQPFRDVICLERAVPKVQVTIEQLGDFAGGAWFPNLVQRSQNVLPETTTRIWSLLHR